MGVLMLALLGSLLGFLLFNFNPARVFMGDSGSMFLGFFLATASIVSATKVATVMGLALPALALGLPLFDMMLSIVRRLLDRRSIFAADRGHIHHRLLDGGLKHPHAVVVMYLVTVLTAGAGLMMMVWRGEGEIIVFVVALLILMFAFRLAGMIRFREMYSQVHENLTRQRDIRRERKQYESARSRLRAAWTFMRLARRMGFAQIAIEVRGGDDGEPETLVYRRPENRRPDMPIMHLSIPVRASAAGRLLRVEIDVTVDEPLETIGRRVSLFGRLLDEHEIGDEPTTADAAEPTATENA
jgi:hypothetical protein